MSPWRTCRSFLCGAGRAEQVLHEAGRGRVGERPRQVDRPVDGLTNREIGDRLFLSPRTVSSHLYRSYPKLGVAGRNQLRDVIARASMLTPADESAGSQPVL
jgi:DNA-binding NarL/FixJ family response regulator